VNVRFFFDIVVIDSPLGGFSIPPVGQEGPNGPFRQSSSRGGTLLFLLLVISTFSFRFREHPRNLGKMCKNVIFLGTGSLTIRTCSFAQVSVKVSLAYSTLSTLLVSLGRCRDISPRLFFFFFFFLLLLPPRFDESLFFLCTQMRCFLLCVNVRCFCELRAVVPLPANVFNLQTRHFFPALSASILWFFNPLLSHRPPGISYPSFFTSCVSPALPAGPLWTQLS